MSDLWSVWFLIGAAFVFWMQAGFAMVETGFTRAKNAGNIIMKNLMDFCIGTVMWFLIGASFMLSFTDPVTGEISRGIWSVFGKPGFSVFTDYAHFDFSNFVFNLVFCATTATIVSGAMAERTKFSSYCIYSAIISGIIYPIEAHWTWGGGFLAQWGFHDYAGSACIHMVGGICALIGAAMVGPRIGKFTRDEGGKVVKVKAFPGHNLTIGALGVFILWLGWYGFNGAAATDVPTLGSVFLTTTVAPAVATVVTMIFTWIKYGKPDVSMCLNASLAGLVAITAPCDVTDCAGAAIIGAVAGLLVVFGIWLLDYKLHIDDPVGAVAVHMMNGIWGTIAVGLFATKSAPGFELAGISEGLFYGGGFGQLIKQLGGMFVIIAWTVVTILIVFTVIKKLHGLRVSTEEEIIGLDKIEHGLDSSYAGFDIAQNYSSAEVAAAKRDGVKIPEEAAVPVVKVPSSKPDAKFHKVVIVTRQTKFDEIKSAMNDIGVTGMTVTNVLGCGVQHGAGEFYRGAQIDMTLLPKIKVEIVVSEVPVDLVVAAAKEVLYTGHIGDGKIFVYDVENVIKVRTGEEGYEALQD
ncbi:MAG: ammonium transporter [Treponema sp.]|uniref:ammonium transporter n=1 Tax=Treponema sp. TaxID=166 RepID=UPI0025FFE3BB|nr:ammonium transporter [Treponema sp.]MBQ8679277.1 ammonium transporter [Treponema sp.]